MRVLFAVHGFPPGSQGGTELYTRALARALRDGWGDAVAVIARESDPTRPERALRREEQDGLSVTLVNNTFTDVRRFEQTWRDPVIRGHFAHLLDDWRPDLCHVQHLTGLSADIADEAAARQIPTLVTLNDYWLLCQRGQLLDRDLERCDGPHPAGCARCLFSSRREARLRTEGVARVFDTAAAFLAPSRTLLERFVAQGLAPRKLHHQPQGIDHAPFRGLTRQPAAHPRFGFLGSLMASKAPHLVLEAFGRLPEGAATLDVHGAITPYHGDDSYGARLEPLLGAPGVRWSGPLSHEEVPAALAALDVLVVPSIWLENAPFVIREAFLAGVPVVASDLGGMAELVEHEKSGLLFPPGDVGALHASLRRIVDEPGLLDHLRSGLPPVLTIEEDAERTRALYQRLVADA